MSEDINTFLNSFRKVKRTGNNQFLACCPAHDDKKASLSIAFNPGEQKIALHCHAGCRTKDILSAIGKDWSAVMPEQEQKIAPKWHTRYDDGNKYEFVTEYAYRDSEGRYLYSKIRYENKELRDKTFAIGRIINNEIEYGNKGIDRTLYNLPELAKAIKNRKTVFYVEGEKDVETLRKLGLTAISAGGVADWKSKYADYFIGSEEVIIIADHDKPGKKLADDVSRDLRSVVYKHKVITPSGSNSGDVTDYLTEEGGTKEDLFEIIEDAAPVYALWVNSNGKINPDLLAAEFMKRNDMFIARNPGTRSDIIFLYRRGAYCRLSETELAGEIRKWIPLGRAAPETINKVVKMILYADMVKTYEDLDADERFINLKNGLLDINTGELLPHTPELISTLQLDCSFNTEAKAPRWERFIESLCYDPESEEIDQEMLTVLQEVTGFLLSPIYGYRIKMAIMLFSALGNTGKSVFLSVVSKILGKDSTANVDFESLGSSRWATGRAFGKRLLAIGDEGGESINSSKIFKQMTGGDQVPAEFKGLQGFDYTFRGVICAACNLLPFFNDDKGDHVAERFLMLNCRHTIPQAERDLLLINKLFEERDGIFMWAMEGLQRFLDNDMHFSHCQSAEDLKAEYRARHDTMYAFLYSGQYVEVTGNRQDYIRKTVFEDLYEVYCEKNDITNPLKRKNIRPRLASMGITTKTHSHIEVYSGIKEITTKNL